LAAGCGMQCNINLWQKEKDREIERCKVQIPGRREESGKVWGKEASLSLKAKMCFIDKLIAGSAAIKIVALASLWATITN